MMRTFFAYALAALFIFASINAASQTERDAILATAMDYGEGWYTADSERMQRALHPELAKRMIYTDPKSGKSRLSDMGAMTLVNYTRAGGGKSADVPSKTSRVVILDIFENAAVAKVIGPQWVDYLQLAKWNGKWVIVNVLWERNPA